jgi:hypothetical protein
LFETCEVVKVIARQISAIRARKAARGRRDCASRKADGEGSEGGSGGEGVGGEKDSEKDGEDDGKDDGEGDVRHVFDLCCGHGLLGLLLAQRFPEVLWY